jgi:cytochrome P450
MNPQEKHAMPLPPGPPDQFDVGDTDDSLAKLVAYFKSYGDIFRIYSPSRGADTYVISHPDWAKHVLVTNHRNYTKGVGINRVKVLLGNGIMVSEGDFWRRQRLMIQPLFHKRAIQRFCEMMIECNQALVDRWLDSATRGKPVDVTGDVSEVTLKIILRAIFSEDLSALASKMGGNPFLVVAKESARDLRFAAQFRSLKKPILAIIEQRRSKGIQRSDLLSMLMSARDKRTGEPMHDKELIDEVMTLIVAGHETSASGLNWLWYLVSQHPEIELELQAAVDQLSSPTAVDSLLSLDLVRHVVDETLRLYPPGWLITRRAIGDDVLGGFPIAPGTDILISPYLLHRHPRYWEEPEQFRPQRFAAADAKERYRFVYLPFVVGPRHCVGETFALTEMQIHVAVVIRNLSLRYIGKEPVEMEPRVNLRTAHNLLFQPVLR